MNDSKNQRRKAEKEGFSFRLKLKKYRLLLSYYFKKHVGRLNLAYILFVINLILFSLILIPNLAHRSPIPLGSWPMVLEIHGKVLVKNDSVGSFSSLIPAPEVKVEIGGYHTWTDHDGGFHLSFTSQTYTDIPIVFYWSNKTVLRWTSFEHGQFAKKEVFVI